MPHMSEQPAEIQVGYRLDCMARELDEIRKMAGNLETANMIKNKLSGAALLVQLALRGLEK